MIACVLSCCNNTSGKEKDDCGEIIKEIVIEDGKLLSPEWLVKVMKEYEKEAIEIKMFYLYVVYVFEYQQETYVRIHESLYSGSSGRDDYYTCSGQKICECKGILQSQFPLCQDLRNAIVEQGNKPVFDALFCHNEQVCDSIRTTYRYSLF